MTLDEILARIAELGDRASALRLRAEEVSFSANELEDDLTDLESDIRETQTPTPSELEIREGVFWFTPNQPPQAARYDAFFLQQDPTARERIALHPAAWHALFKTPVVERDGDPNGYSTALSPAEIPSAWYYWRNGQKITRIGPNGDFDIFVNPGNPDYIKAVVAKLPGVIRGVGAQAVLLDEYDENPNYSFQNSGVLASTHQAGLLALLRAVAPAMRAQGLETIVNLGANYWPMTQWVRDISLAADGVWIEQFIGRRLAGYAAPATIGDMWESQIQYGFWMTQQGKRFTVNVAHSDQEVINYAFLSYLLIADSKSAFCSQPGGNGTPAYVSNSLLEAAYALGPATGSMVLNISTGTATRQFANGSVSVFPTLAKWKTGRIDV
jgi:hypothetical protein